MINNFLIVPDEFLMDSLGTIINYEREKNMKHYIKTITWKFMDSTEIYPQLKNKRIKITAPSDVFENFRFCSTVK